MKKKPVNTADGLIEVTFDEAIDMLKKKYIASDDIIEFVKKHDTELFNKDESNEG